MFNLKSIPNGDDAHCKIALVVQALKCRYRFIARPSTMAFSHFVTKLKFRQNGKCNEKNKERKNISTISLKELMRNIFLNLWQSQVIAIDMFVFFYRAVKHSSLQHYNFRPDWSKLQH